MNRSTSSASNSTELSEDIVVVGRGVPSHSKKFRCLAYCIAGLENNSSWVRLYPIRSTRYSSRLNKSDIIRVRISDEHSDFRSESKKPDLSAPPNIIGVVPKEDHLQLLNDNLDSGTFLHDDSWKGRKTLGLIKPIYPEFKIDKNRILVKYKCDHKRCKGHLTEVHHYTMEEYELEDRIFSDRNGLEKSLIELNRQILLHRKQLWFVMGTILNHPRVWIIIEVYIT